ncbi:MAG TPA: glucosyltransferase domain-containing protein [Candidatus Gemmiger stercoravium]|nr:glucosyltransferase domain-containing protein [Candidatus Gemmiger stercoravium]
MSDTTRTNLGVLARRPTFWAGLAALTALGYARAMASPAVGIDDLAIATYQQGGGFLRQSRITEWLVQALTGLLSYQAFWPEFWAAVCLALAGALLAAVLYTAAGRRPVTGGALLLAGGLLLYPFHAEAMAYSNLCLTGLGVLLAVWALALGEAFLMDWRDFSGALGAVACLVFSLGCYESMAQVWLTLLMVRLLTPAVFASRRSRPTGWWLGPLLRGVLLFAAGLAGREMLAILLRLLLGVTGADGAAARTIYWTERGGLLPALQIFVREFLGCYGTLALAVPAIALLDLACLTLIVFTAVRRWGNGCGWLAAGLILAQFAMGILQGTGSQMARASQCFAVFVPYVVWLLLETLPRRRLIAALAVVLLGAEAVSLNMTFEADRARWQYERTLLQGIGEQLDVLDPSGELPVVFVGEISLPDTASYRLPAGHPAYKAAWVLSVTLGAPMGDLYPYEEVNESVINWAQSAFGSHEQMYLLMDQAGRPCARPSEEQQTEGEALADGNEAVTLQDGYLLVSLDRAGV